MVINSGTSQQARNISKRILISLYPCPCGAAPTFRATQLCYTDSSRKAFIMCPIRIGHGYSPDTCPSSIQKNKSSNIYVGWHVSALFWDRTQPPALSFKFPTGLPLVSRSTCARRTSARNPGKHGCPTHSTHKCCRWPPSTSSCLIFTILDFWVGELVDGDASHACWLIGKLQNCNCMFRVLVCIIIY